MKKDDFDFKIWLVSIGYFWLMAGGFIIVIALLIWIAEKLY